MERIKEIDIFGTKYSVEWKDDTIKLEDGSIREGQTVGAERCIEISTGHNGTAFPEEHIELIFYHELIHAILMEGCYFNSNNDEPQVEWIAKNIRNLKKQGIL